MTIHDTDPARHRTPGPRRRETVEEQARRRGIKPMTFSDNDTPCDDVFESDEELEAFLEFYRAERRANLA